MPQAKQRRTPAAAPKRKAAAATVDYRALAQFRFELRTFLAFSEEGARKAGLTPQQHQALLGIKGFVEPGPPSVGDIARFLLIRHHSAVELMNRMAKLGLISRVTDPVDGRRVQLKLTAKGEQKLQAISKKNIEELRRAASPALRRLLRSSPQPDEP
ncbi:MULTISPECIES: MarR family winged helix-turn-helix transcriptional regulator [Bradyrhizobium]|uniref:MarR family winged helix-turn-helix transcriptional regulator n=1 Tax=Bradyrhizobium TaxID=374 RepID=UPI00067F165D|nr:MULTISPECIES: MarR family transcriptional regulator [Bradyrhizobium]PAY10183.1 MarR family transcriptional regulator [Bradyrhizobium sp. UFLA03-84]